MTIRRAAFVLRRRAAAAVADRTSSGARRRLVADRREQLERFASLPPQFADRYRALAGEGVATSPPWRATRRGSSACYCRCP